MPKINRYSCSECEIHLHTGWGGHQYVVDNQGDSVCCSHPQEIDTICKELNITLEEWYLVDLPYIGYKIQTPSWRWSRKRKDDYQNRLDERVCRHCGSNEIATLLEMIGKLCPFSENGQIIETYTGVT